MSIAGKLGEKARALLEKADAYAFPVNIERVTECLGLKIVEQPLEDEYSGFLAIKDKTIVVNASHPPARRRFTIAHEIGHYQLHRAKAESPVFIDRTVYFRSAQFDAAERKREREANHFAAELLMPEELLADYLDKHDPNLLYPREVKALADEFGVSKQAMDFRLRDLGFVLPTSI